jgi:xylulokinase
MPRRRRSMPIRTLPQADRQYRLSRLHRAEARLGESQRAPDIFAKVAKVLLPKDYLRLWLTGEHISEMSDSAGTSWLDVGKRAGRRSCWPPPASTEKHMPSLVEGTEQGGKLRGELASQMGHGRRRRRRRCRRQCGVGLRHGHGQPWACLRVARHLGRAVCRQWPICRSRKAPCTPFCHALPNTWHQMGVILSATDALNWHSDITGKIAADLTGRTRRRR